MQHYRRKPLNLLNFLTTRNIGSPILDDILDSHLHPDHPPSLHETASALNVPVLPPSGLATGSNAAPQMSDPTALVQQATSILQQELAQGLPTGLEPERSQDPSSSSANSPSMGVGELRPEGILATAHSFIDQFARVMAQRPMPKGLSSNLEHSNTESSNSSEVPLVRSPSGKPGETVQLTFKVHNDSDQGVQVQFFGTDLVSQYGTRIPSNAILSTAPLSLTPDQIADVTLMVKIPLQIAAGSYFGLAVASNLPDLVAAVQLTVI